jgi:hypothetical protein
LSRQAAEGSAKSAQEAVTTGDHDGLMLRDLALELLLHQFVKVRCRRSQTANHLVLLRRDRAAEEVVDK